jgi:recombination protein RecR
MVPKPIKKIVEIFSRFPTIGERTATRFALYLISLKKDEVENIVESILGLINKIKKCEFCFNPFEPKNESQKLCEICLDKKREKTKTILVVESESDLWQIEKIKKYQGRYFILGGKMDFLKENPLGKLRIEEFKKRIEEFGPKEIILAINPTVEGNLTMDYIKRILKPYNIKITQLAKGLPIGGEIEYTDEETLSSALEGRK